MIRSMTGFGKASGHILGQEVVVEISAVNHRYFDISLRLPTNWGALESEIKQLLREKISRGKINGTVSRKGLPAKGQAVQFDMETARQYIEAASKLAEVLKTDETLSLNVLMRLEGVFVPVEPEEDVESIRQPLLKLVCDATDKLNKMRALEGEKLADDIRQRLTYIATILTRVESRLPEISAEYEKRLRTRIDELKGEVNLTEERIAIEVALLAEKADVSEELVRMKAHLGHMTDLLNEHEPVGRRLDFLTQELQRETNTLGVKTRESGMIQEILTVKAEVEKIREQVQNIE